MEEFIINYIIPKNYNFKNKILGIVDYPTAILNIILFFLTYKLSFAFNFSITLKIFFFIIFYFPIFLISIFFISSSNDSFLYTLYYIFKFILKPKLYLYK